MTFKVFISSNVQDREVITQLEEALSKCGIESSWMDRRERLHFGESGVFNEFTEPFATRHPIITFGSSHGLEIAESIRRVMREYGCMLMLVIKGEPQDNALYDELFLAKFARVPIIPIVEKGAEVPKILENRQYIQIDEKLPRLSYERAAQYLKRLTIKKETKNTISALVLLSISFLILRTPSSRGLQN